MTGVPASPSGHSAQAPEPVSRLGHSANVLNALAERCEAATGPDREMDAAVAVAIKLRCRPNLPDDLEHLSVPRKSDHCALGTYWFHCRSGMSLRTAPAYTASLDAAMTLIDADTFFHLSRFDKEADGRAEAHLYPNRFVGDDYQAEAASPALALCAAALRARAAQ